nr:hypothetical protein [Tanacetum cinerariifolium]
MEDQPLPVDASPTALSPSYVVNSDSEKDEKDPEEDPADYPADKGDNDDDESSNDNDDDDDVKKDEEDKEEEEHLALADPSDRNDSKQIDIDHIKCIDMTTDIHSAWILLKFPTMIDDFDVSSDEEEALNFNANEYAEQEVKELQEFQVTGRLEILELRSRAKDEAAELRAETLQVSLGAARMDVRDLIRSRKADRFEMAELQSQAHDIEASFWDLETHLGP